MRRELIDVSYENPSGFQVTRLIAGCPLRHWGGQLCTFRASQRHWLWLVFPDNDCVPPICIFPTQVCRELRALIACRQACPFAILALNVTVESLDASRSGVGTIAIMPSIVMLHGFEPGRVTVANSSQCNAIMVVQESRVRRTVLQGVGAAHSGRFGSTAVHSIPEHAGSMERSVWGRV